MSWEEKCSTLLTIPVLYRGADLIVAHGLRESLSFRAYVWTARDRRSLHCAVENHPRSATPPALYDAVFQFPPFRAGLTSGGPVLRASRDTQPIFILLGGPEAYGHSGRDDRARDRSHLEGVGGQ